MSTKCRKTSSNYKNSSTYMYVIIGRATKPSAHAAERDQSDFGIWTLWYRMPLELNSKLSFVVHSIGLRSNRHTTAHTTKSIKEKTINSSGRILTGNSGHSPACIANVLYIQFWPKNQRNCCIFYVAYDVIMLHWQYFCVCVFTHSLQK